VLPRMRDCVVMMPSSLSTRPAGLGRLTVERGGPGCASRTCASAAAPAYPRRSASRLRPARSRHVAWPVGSAGRSPGTGRAWSPSCRSAVARPSRRRARTRSPHGHPPAGGGPGGGETCAHCPRFRLCWAHAEVRLPLPRLRRHLRGVAAHGRLLRARPVPGRSRRHGQAALHRRRHRTVLGSVVAPVPGVRRGLLRRRLRLRLAVCRPDEVRGADR
jgi:hypothetical protein